MTTPTPTRLGGPTPTRLPSTPQLPGRGATTPTTGGGRLPSRFGPVRGRTPETFQQPGLPPRTDAGIDYGTEVQRDALARVKEMLREYGLEGLADFVWDQIIAGKSDAEIFQDIRNTAEFKARFPAIDERQKRGLPSLSPEEYVQYERQARQIMRAAGLPESFYDSADDFQNFLVNDVSVSELNDRIQLGRQAAFEAPAEVRQALLEQYGVTEGGLTAYFLDPDKAQPLLEKQFRASQIGGAARRTGFGAVSTTEAERLATLGISADQAQQGFGTLADSRELFQSIDRTENQIGRDEQLGAVFEGSAAARRRIEQRRRKRQSVFEQGGSFAAGQQGVAGLGDV